MSKKILILAGDGIGTEIAAEAQAVLEALRSAGDLDVEIEHALLGGAAYDAHGDPLPEQTLALLGRLAPVLALGYPVLVGPSRKRFIASVFDAPPGERVAGTVAACVVAYLQGARIFRVHDVAPVVQALAVARAVLRARSGHEGESTR